MAIVEQVLQPTWTATEAGPYTNPPGVFPYNPYMVGGADAFGDGSDDTYGQFSGNDAVWGFQVTFAPAVIPSDAVVPSDNTYFSSTGYRGLPGFELFARFRGRVLAARPFNASQHEGNAVFSTSQDSGTYQISGNYPHVTTIGAWTNIETAADAYATPVEREPILSSNPWVGFLQAGVAGHILFNGACNGFQLSEYVIVLRYEGSVAAPPSDPARAVRVRSTPSLRMLQRGGQGGMSGIPRMIGNPVRGLRQGPGSVY